VAKRIILYNLADNVTDEQFKDYVVSEKGPLIDCPLSRSMSWLK